MLAAGWEWVKEDAYDDQYYRRWMHELPPLIHRERDRMIDVHHAILPPTARPKPDMEAMIADRLELADGLFTLSPPDMIVHAAAHLFADGDLAGGLRNLWDIDRLLREFAERDPNFWPRLREQAERHGLLSAVGRAVRLAHRLYATPVNWGQAPISRGTASTERPRRPEIGACPQLTDALFRRRLLARDGWGRARNPRHPLRLLRPLALAAHAAADAGPAFVGEGEAVKSDRRPKPTAGPFTEAQSFRTGPPGKALSFPGDKSSAFPLSLDL